MKYYDVELTVAMKKTVRVKISDDENHLHAIQKAMDGELAYANVVDVQWDDFNLVAETKELPSFHAMSNDELESYIRENNKGMYDLGEVIYSYDEDDEDEAVAYRDELESVAEEIFYNNK